MGNIDCWASALVLGAMRKVARWKVGRRLRSTLKHPCWARHGLTAAVVLRALTQVFKAERMDPADSIRTEAQLLKMAQHACLLLGLPLQLQTNVASRLQFQLDSWLKMSVSKKARLVLENSMDRTFTGTNNAQVEQQYTYVGMLVGGTQGMMNVTFQLAFATSVIHVTDGLPLGVYRSAAAETPRAAVW